MRHEKARIVGSRNERTKELNRGFGLDQALRHHLPATQPRKMQPQCITVQELLYSHLSVLS